MSDISPTYLRELAHRLVNVDQVSQAMYAADVVRLAADELERLSAAFADAPHDSTCASRFPIKFHKPFPCSCWKADLP